MKGDLTFFALFAVILLTILGLIAWGISALEAEAYNRQTGKHLTAWDMFILGDKLRLTP